jgi:putative methionine-R-sulfoxide reductase with GAF domain
VRVACLRQAGHRSAGKIVIEQKNKPVLDERTFDKLLEAAYVIQQHRRKVRDAEERMESHSQRLREQEQEPAEPSPLRENTKELEKASRSESDYTLTLAEIVEAQRQIQARNLELDKALAVVAEKVTRITNSSGAAVGILDEKMVRYRAGAGTSALPVESEIPLASAICAASVRTGQVIRTEDVNTEVLFDPEPCRQRGILSLVVVPIYRDGDIVGALEIYFDRIHGFTEQDIHTCQLMAGLVTEAISRDAEVKLKMSMAAERSTMLAAIEKLQPNLAALAEQQSAAIAGADTGMEDRDAVAAKVPCWKCGNLLVAEEQFCGRCGAPRVTDDESSTVQSKLASAWHMQQTVEEGWEAEPADETEEMPVPVATHDTNAVENDLEEDDGDAEPAEESSLPEFEDEEAKSPEESALPEFEESAPRAAGSFHASADADEDSITESLSSKEQAAQEEENLEASSAALAKPQQEEEEMVWSSAAKARDFLESLSGTRSDSAFARFWRSRRGDFYLAVAVILMVVVIRWGIWSDHSVNATAGGTAVSGGAARHKPAAPDADLSLLDRLLISFGLAEAPDEAPQYKGNPDTQVWVDLHTALYYCPGSDLYGKTPKGKVSTQREAQMDQFEPASRKPCD